MISAKAFFTAFNETTSPLIKNSLGQFSDFSKRIRLFAARQEGVYLLLMETAIQFLAQDLIGLFAIFGSKIRDYLEKRTCDVELFVVQKRFSQFVNSMKPNRGHEAVREKNVAQAFTR